MMLAVAATSFQKGIAVLDYQLNKDYISAKLCVNRNRPSSCCHGKCFLKKQLQKEDGQDKNSNPSSREKNDVSLYCEPLLNREWASSILNSNFSDQYLLKKYNSSVSSIFHPPGNA